MTRSIIPSPRMASLLSQAWAITPPAMRTLQGLARAGVVESIQAYAATVDAARIKARHAHADSMIWQEEEDYFDPLTDAHIRPSGVGVFPVRGPLFDRGWMCYLGYDQIVETCREFEAHYYARKELQDTPDLIAVVMPFDSPGGVCVGWKSAVDAIKRLSSIVPVYSVADREACSAAEGLAAQATKSFCTEDSFRGSCGARMTHEDFSRALSEDGIDVRHFTSGRYKTVGAGDVPRSPETVEVFTDFTARWAQIFREIMAQGRGMTPQQFDAMEARIYFGPDAVDVGLCDGVMDYETLIDRLEAGEPV